MNIATNLERTALYFPDRTAVIENGKSTNYGKFNEDASRVANSLKSLGIVSGDTVALFAPNSYHWLVFYFGALKVGAAVATPASALSRDEIFNTFRDCRPKAVFTTDDRLNQLEGMKDETGMEFLVSPGTPTSMDSLLDGGSPHFKAVYCDRHEPAVILFTGGTTGISKGVPLSHENLQTSYQNVSFSERSTHQDRCLCFLPLNHVFAQIHIMGSTVYSGGSMVIQPGFDMDRALDAIKRYRVSKFYSVPTVYIRMLSIKDLRERLKSVRYCFSAAASMAAELVREWKTRMDLNIHEAYGMTESASMVTFNHYCQHVVGSVGTPANLVEVQIRGLDGSVLGPEEEGEICIRGPNIMKAYLNRPDETALGFRDEWLRSGDIGLLDDKGYLYIVDRLKDLIITGGENVYPREVEELLYTRPEVQECAVVGLPDAEYGERVVAVIVPKPNQTIDADQLKTFFKAKVAPFKVPKAYVTVDEMPKSHAGKVLKRDLKTKLMNTSGVKVHADSPFSP